MYNNVIEFNDVFDIAKKFLNGKDLIEFLQQLNVKYEFEFENAVYIYQNMNITPQEFKSILSDWDNEDFRYLIEEGYDIDEDFIDKVIGEPDWEQIIEDEDNIMKLSDKNFRILFEKVSSIDVPLTKDIFNRCLNNVMKQKNNGFHSEKNFWGSSCHCNNLYEAMLYVPDHFSWDDGGKFGSMPYYVSHCLEEIEDWYSPDNTGDGRVWRDRSTMEEYGD